MNFSEALKCASSIINKSTSYVFLMRELNISILQLENIFLLMHSLIHCSFKTSVGTAIKTFVVLFLLIRDDASINEVFVLPTPVA